MIVVENVTFLKDQFWHFGFIGQLTIKRQTKLAPSQTETGSHYHDVTPNNDMKEDGSTV